ncbi:carboxypeptidase-like regulatory domain-containing protein [Pedobacter sp. Leaf132]|uniref:carboxypeptidase-like regulatory domain-containing protein n=1 Tax=Pedobacter sp. Leaf132 TaxID=2876557 RepID=UPI001E631E68|nr:carboxypeptidase-like regulatory domain-containing protein [Pedobacter sp. Leaf132]
MKKLLLSFFLSFCVITSVFAQDKPISGKVTSGTGEPLPGVSVYVKGTPANGTQTNASGEYRLTVPQNANTLTFTFVGYKSKDVAIRGNTVNANLEVDNTTLSDVVVVGYGTQSKRDLLGSQARVTAAEMKDRPLATVESALQGKAPGVFIN